MVGGRNVSYVCIFRYPYLLLKDRDLLLYDSGITYDTGHNKHYGSNWWHRLKDMAD
jgi:hypothetical protein